MRLHLLSLKDLLPFPQLANRLSLPYPLQSSTWGKRIVALLLIASGVAAIGQLVRRYFGTMAKAPTPPSLDLNTARLPLSWTTQIIEVMEGGLVYTSDDTTLVLRGEASGWTFGDDLECTFVQEGDITTLQVRNLSSANSSRPQEANALITWSSIEPQKEWNYWSTDLPEGTQDHDTLSPESYEGQIAFIPNSYVIFVRDAEGPLLAIGFSKPPIPSDWQVGNQVSVTIGYDGDDPLEPQIRMTNLSGEGTTPSEATHIAIWTRDLQK
jgi:hypothetical protein